VNELKRFLAALQYFTRLPVPRWVGHSQALLDDSVRYFPAVGLVVGAIGAVALLGAARLWSAAVAVLISMIATLLATGAFHEDGLADAVDGLGGGLDRTRALEIMKDSRIGAFGAIALGMALLLKFVTLSSVPSWRAALLLLAGHAVSRLGAVFIMTTMPYARESDDSRSKPLVQHVSVVSVVIATLTGIAALTPMGWAGVPMRWTDVPMRWQYVPMGWAVVPGLLAVGLVCLAWGLYLRRRLGGYTGDCLGAAQQLGECAFYLACTATY
jgi:adenosylcobinamide-GDP ribazoletransferase